MIEMIHRYLVERTFDSYAEVFAYVEALSGEALDDYTKLAIQRNQELFINGEQYQFFRVSRVAMAA